MYVGLGIHSLQVAGTSLHVKIDENVDRNVKLWHIYMIIDHLIYEKPLTSFLNL
jgi:hypothetical protein